MFTNIQLINKPTVFSPTLTSLIFFRIFDTWLSCLSLLAFLFSFSLSPSLFSIKVLLVHFKVQCSYFSVFYYQHSSLLLLTFHRFSQSSILFQQPSECWPSLDKSPLTWNHKATLLLPIKIWYMAVPQGL